jgi:D-alanyl-D-alanine endopeptidase (penicillin-binding protein 7)
VKGNVVRKPSFRIGVVLFAGLVALSGGAADASPGARSANAKRTPAPSIARKAQSARARAVAQDREAAETAVARYKVDAAGDLVPDLRAAAAIIYNPDTNQVLWEENSEDERSIASITKVMTAVVFLESNPDVSQEVTIARSDVYGASTTRLRLNDRVTVDDLLHLLLLPSDNAAARALARVYQGGADAFMTRMNEKAVELGLLHTHYADPSGLLSDNVSSALDMARLIALASSDDRIGSIMRLHEHTIQTPRRTFAIRNTNRLLSRTDLDVRAGKTGFISTAGYCLVTLLRLPQSNQEVAVVVLGARSNAARFLETQNLFNWLSAKASTIFATQTPAVAPQQ